MSLKVKPRGRKWWAYGTIDRARIRRPLKASDYTLAVYECAKLQEKLEREAILGKEVVATFGDACNRYFDDNPVPKGKRDQMSAFLVPILRELRNHRLVDISPNLVKGLARKLYPNCKPQSWNTTIIAPVSAVINHVHQDGWCPPIHIKKFRARDARLQQPGDREWLHAFMAAAISMKLPHLAALAEFCFQTGARANEACKLRPDQLDLDNERALSDVTKNGKRREYILVDPEHVALLRHLQPQAIQKGNYAGEIRVFGYPNPRSLLEPWQKVCKAAGLVYLTRHEAGRHGHLTETIVRCGANVVTASKLGNVSPQVAIEKYAHADAPEKLAREIFGTKTAQGNRERAKKLAASRG